MRSSQGSRVSVAGRARQRAPALLLAPWLVAAGWFAPAPADGQESSPAASPPAAHEPPRFTLHGFGTLGFVHSSEEQADWIHNPLRPDGAGFSREWSPEIDSRLGLQLNAELTGKLTGVVQVIVEQRYDDHYEPTLEWANLKYTFTDDFSVRVGRTALPTFAASDYRKVSYVNPWVRPPVELYSLVPIFNSDGIDASYRHRFTGWTHTVQATLGESHVDLPGGATARVHGLTGLFDTLERGFLTLRAAFATADVTIESEPSLFDAFRGFGDAGQEIAERFEADDRQVHFAGLAASYDPGSWFLSAELGRIRTRSFLGDRTAGYLTFGLRRGAVTPFATYSEAVADSPTSSPGLAFASLPAPLQPPAAALNFALNDLLASIAVQRTWSLGARWDYRPDAALKVQLDRVEVDAESFGTFVNRQPAFARGARATLVSIATSFVF